MAHTHGEAKHAVIYTGALFMISMTGIEADLMIIASAFALVGAAYALLGGLRAVAVSDTYGGVLVLAMGLLIVILSLMAIDFDFSGIPQERLTLIGLIRHMRRQTVNNIRSDFWYLCDLPRAMPGSESLPSACS